jgi:hypothetical protein
MATIDTATEEEDLRIVNAYIATSNAVGDAILALKRLEAITFDIDELNELVLRRRELEDEYAVNERAFLAYCDGSIGMHPPSAGEVAEIVRIAGELAQLTQKKAEASAVLQLANAVNARFQEISGKG